MFSLMPLRVPSGCRALDPGRNPEQMPTIFGPGRIRQPLPELGHVLGPAEPGEPRDEGRAGEIVEQEVQWSPRVDLLWHFGGDGGAQVPAGVAPDQSLQTFGRRIGLDLGDVALGDR